MVYTWSEAHFCPFLPNLLQFLFFPPLSLKKKKNIYIYIYLLWTIFKVFIEFVPIFLLFYVLVFWPEVCGILAPQPGIEPSPPALESEILTNGSPGKSFPTFLN